MSTLSPEALDRLLAETSEALVHLRANSDSIARLTRGGQSKQTIVERVVDCIPGILLVVDPTRKSLIWANDRLTTVLGYRISEVIKVGNRSMNTLLLKDERRHMQDALTWFGAGNKDPYRALCRMTSAYDDDHTFSLQVTPFSRDESNMIDQLLFVALDVTQQTQTEYELKRMLRDIVNPREDKRIRSITRRELQIVQLIAREQNTKQIAAALNISIPTVETHRRNLLHKLNIKNTAGLVRFAVEQQLV
jgi:DNA-binding CsgD family transcriptional regulator